MDLASGRSNAKFGSIRVNVGDGRIFTEVNAAGSSVINVSVERGDGNWRLSGCRGWVLDGWASGGE